MFPLGFILYGTLCASWTWLTIIFVFGLLCLVWQSLGPSMLLQMTLLHSFLCLSSIPLYCMYICTIIFFIHSTVGAMRRLVHVMATVNNVTVTPIGHFCQCSNVSRVKLTPVISLYWVFPFDLESGFSFDLCSVFVFSVAHSCLTLCNPMDYSPWGSSVHGISQARTLEWVAISFSRGSSWSRDWTCISCISFIGRQILNHCDTWEAPILHLILVKRP